MTTSAERYPDLVGDQDDPALTRLIADLDQALRAPTPPAQLHSALQRLMDQRAGGQPAPAARSVPPLLSRKEALKAGAAGAAWLLALGQPSAALANAAARAAAMDSPMTAARLAEIMRTERAQWDALLARVGADRMAEPGVEGTWSVKEMIAHLTWYERVVVEGARQVMSGGTYVRSGLAVLGMDERNARIADESRERPLQEVLADSRQVFERLLAVIQACPDDLLNDPRRLGLPAEVVPWTLVAANSFEHYQQHAQAIRAWLDPDGGPEVRASHPIGGPEVRPG